VFTAGRRVMVEHGRQLEEQGKHFGHFELHGSFSRRCIAQAQGAACTRILLRDLTAHASIVVTAQLVLAPHHSRRHSTENDVKKLRLTLVPSNDNHQSWPPSKSIPRLARKAGRLHNRSTSRTRQLCSNTARMQSPVGRQSQVWTHLRGHRAADEGQRGLCCRDHVRPSPAQGVGS
jgi:hypothetical protein